MGRSRRLGWNALILAIAALLGIMIGDALAPALAGKAPPPALRSPEPAAHATPRASGAAPAPRAHVVELALDGRARLDGGRPLGDAAAIAAALRGATGDVIVVPHAEVPWAMVVDFVDLVRRVTMERCIVRLDAPRE